LGLHLRYHLFISMKQHPFIFALCVFLNQATAQTTDPTDSSQVLQAVVVRGYEQSRKLLEVSAPISYISKAQLERFNNTGILPAMNTTAGVRMEERSPGSYRLNIRGSSLRSPFGVRNVKVYWNNIPFTDAGGNTYLNQLSFYNVNSVEVIKGPASSLYGAGTGGAVLIKSLPTVWKPNVAVNYVAGSFGHQMINSSLQFGSEEVQQTIGYTHQNSDGYRVQSKMKKDVFTYEAKVSAGERDQLNVFFLYGDLYYQTPGGLTKVQYEANPKEARPAAGIFPGAVQAQAAIYQKTFLAGFSNQYQFNSRFGNTTSLYGAFSQIENPAIRNFEKRNEPHAGGRTVFSYHADIRESGLNFVLGGEVQKGFSNIKVYRNRQGSSDSLQTDDEIDNLQYFVFAQAELELKGGWIFTAGTSLNKSTIEFSRVSTVPPMLQKRTYSNEIAPRFSVLKKLTENLAVYTSVSKGFSPPTLAELLPSTSIINTSLEAEDGTNYELGVRGSFLQDKLFLDVNAFLFSLKNTLAQRRDASGADYFENAGSTRQRGIETNITWQPVKQSNTTIADIRLFVSHTFHHFIYKNYKQINTDLSGKKLPSVSPHAVAGGIDIATKPGIYTNINYYYSDPIPLNDANTDIASSFHLLGARLGYRKTFKDAFRLDVFGVVDNIFDTTYSLGNDINAAAGRYYNAAPGINYSGGVSLRYSW
jgi:iron complex outermembrane receptor protein